ncbi:hypothetical protein ANCCAN_13148 [Ancylostoma caninum]|uniref:Uncharacterized protein n=1 Tax=Ancylostoma caninum TaxID=29170 RepID=A0A368G937_ANCCA|nr:hypothetical protein ANCCAN_13148 [Ancylostoma caninum]
MDYDAVSRFFVQWVECSVVLVVGFIINIIRGFPQFEWVAAIGGVLYATGTHLTRASQADDESICKQINIVHPMH